MNKKILITDNLFIQKEHEILLQNTGYEIERLDKPKAGEEELVKAIKGKVGYILGGVEAVTKPVIDAADELKVIAFTGIDYRSFIPAWEYATKKGIAITNTPDAPTHAVAEWAIMAALAMTRGLFIVGRAGTEEFKTTKGLEGANIGVIGAGRIGSHIVGMIKVFRPGKIYYMDRSKKLDVGELVSKEEVFAKSDVVFICVPKDAGDDFIGKNELSKMKDGSLLVSFAHPGLVNEDALFDELISGRIRAIYDHPTSEGFSELPMDVWYSNNGSNAFNTYAGIKLASDTATNSIINFLSNGDDALRAN